MSSATSINPKCLITRTQAALLVPDLVDYTEGKDEWFDRVNDAQNSVRKGQKVVVAFKDWKNPQKSTYAIVKVTSVKSDCYEAIDGPVIRVTDGKVSWRTDGADFIYPVDA